MSVFRTVAWSLTLATAALAQVGPIQTQMNGFCLDVPAGRYQEGQRLAMYRCNGGQNQSFRWTPGGPITIGGYCVDALGGGGNNGDPIALWGCNGGANQRWSMDGQNRLVGINGRCMDIASGNAAEGAGLVLYDCHTGANQKWYAGGALVPAASVSGPLTNPQLLVAASENDRKARCLDTQSRNPGSPIVAYDCHGGESQLFQVNPSGTINLFDTSLCLDAKNGPGQPLVFDWCNGGASQKFYVNNLIRTTALPRNWDQSRPLRPGATPGQLQSQDSSRRNPCVDIEGGRTSNNTRVLNWDCAQGLERPWNQRFSVGKLVANGQAYVYSRHYDPFNMGHMAWAFKLEEGRWLAGAVDGISVPTVPKGQDNGWWMVEFVGADAERQVELYLTNKNDRNGSVPGPHKFGNYTYLKGYSVSQGNPAAALAVAWDSKTWGYGVAGNNCMDVVQKVLAAYGVVLPDPARELSPSGNGLWIPNLWFQALPGAGRTL